MPLPENMNWILKIIDWPCCDQFHVGTIFFPYQRTEGSVHLLIDEQTMHHLDISSSNVQQ